MLCNFDSIGNLQDVFPSWSELKQHMHNLIYNSLYTNLIEQSVNLLFAKSRILYTNPNSLVKFTPKKHEIRPKKYGLGGGGASARKCCT